MPTRLLVPRSRYDEGDRDRHAGLRRTSRTATPPTWRNCRARRSAPSSASACSATSRRARKKAPASSSVAAGRRSSTKGYFVEPTLFADVDNSMTIAREEIFGPVLIVIPFDDDDDAVRIANDNQYGLGGYVTSGSVERAHGGRRAASGPAPSASTAASPTAPTHRSAATRPAASVVRTASRASSSTSRPRPSPPASPDSLRELCAPKRGACRARLGSAIMTAPVEQRILHDRFDGDVDQLDANSEWIAVVGERRGRHAAVAAADLQRTRGRREVGRVASELFGPEPDVVQVRVFVALPHGAGDLFDEFEVRR